MKMTLLYLAAIVAAELVTTLTSAVVGVVFHTFLLLILVTHASLASQRPAQRLYLSLSLAPLIRIVSLAMPLGEIPIIYWYAIVAGPLLTATFLSVRLLGYSRGDVGLTLSRLPLQLLVGLTGLPLGIVEYVILRAKPLADSFSFAGLWLPVVILVVGTGFVEELIFRGVLQKAALERMRGWGLLYVSLLFAFLHVGYYSVNELVFVFTVGLLFAWVVRRTGSIVGASLAHGLLNSTLFLFVPLWGIFVLPLGPAQIPDIVFSPLSFSLMPVGAATPEVRVVKPTLEPNEVPTSTPALLPTTSMPSGFVVVSSTEGWGVYVRELPTLKSTIRQVLPEGTFLWLAGEQAQAHGYTWWKVRTPQGSVGWIAANSLTAVAMPTSEALAAPPTATAVPRTSPPLPSD